MYNFIVKCYNLDDTMKRTTSFNLSIIADTIGEARTKYSTMQSDKTGANKITWDSIVAIQELRQLPNE